MLEQVICLMMAIREVFGPAFDLSAIYRAFNWCVMCLLAMITMLIGWVPLVATIVTIAKYDPNTNPIPQPYGLFLGIGFFVSLAFFCIWFYFWLKTVETYREIRSSRSDY